MRTRMTIVLGLIVATLAAGWTATAAVATPPVVMANGFVTDDAGVLSSGEITAANERLSELAAADGGDLYVVFVDEFTDPSSSSAWADETAVSNGLGTDQYLIAIAVEAGQYAISVDDYGSLTDAEIDRVLQAMEDELRASDWSGAIFAAAGAFPGQSGADSGAGMLGLVIAVVVIAIIVVVIVLIVRARQKKKRAAAAEANPDPNDPYAGVSDDDLEQQAGSALVQADDAITSSRQELGFAVAQYGDDSTATFTQVVEAAQAKVGEAFSLKQQLDDEIPDTVAQRRAWHAQIIQLCAEADDLLDDNVEAFEELRKLEAEAPAALERITSRRAAAQPIVDGAPEALAALAQTYDTAALSTVADNPAQAQQRLALADAELAEAGQLIVDAKRGEAAFSIRTAEEAVAQSEQLVAAISALAADLAAVEDQIRARITDLEGDLAAAGALPDAQGRLAPIIARTRAGVDAARASLQAGARNPQQVLEGLDATNAQIDEALGQVREAAEQAERMQRTLQQRLIQAQSQINAANDFLTTRRGAIGATARTRLAEASAAYAEAVAVQATDPVQATERATRAYTLAGEALSYAQSEVSSFNPSGWGGGGYSSSGYSSNSSGSDAFLGGLLGGLFSGGGSSRGGSSWRSSGGGSSWSSGGSSRRSRPSSFGGSSRSSRSSSRGSSRGGGGRSRGGRF